MHWSRRSLLTAALVLSAPAAWATPGLDELADQLKNGGAHIVGDLAELSPVDVPGVDPTTVDHRAQLEASVAALAGTLRQVRQIRRVS